MAVRNIVQIGEEVLRKKSRPIEKIDAKVLELLDDLAETLYTSDNGVGLASPQVGILRRVVVIDIGDGLMELINPEIIFSEGEASMEEGCLSVKGKRGMVTRPFRIKARALNRKGKLIEYDVEDFEARAFCHEIDHLDGILFIDKVTEMLEDEE